MLSKILKPLLVCFAFVLCSQVNAQTLNLVGVTWGIDTDHDGDTSNITEVSNFDYIGATFVQFSDNDGSGSITENDSFTDYSYLKSNVSDFGDMTASFSNWTGSFGTFYNFGSDYLTKVTFDTGSLMTLYSGTQSVMELELNTGSINVQINSEGSTITQFGQLALELQVTSVEEGYFYIKIDGNWVDLYELLDETSSYYDMYDGKVIAEVASTTQTDNISLDNITDEYIEQLAALTGLSESDIESAIGNDLASGYFVTYNDGNLDLGVVPEPGMLSLMGLAFLGLAGFQYRRKTKNSEG
ncbi:PEP-CTERM sorting domain-containing protein [Vibrio salinus]|uniref:PEP-CTERM sorting domain-containing protein n=1 Tax=Vibrio salinus TaxID=2899784 RepID=UPI001E2AD1E0|nr:PEP-CTERM sorting domain-containing protein [Vibrio salinus]MCE0493283.1 PEP-CTERM sorting domain-containing protein [Vibrio salinus]